MRMYTLRVWAVAFSDVGIELNASYPQEPQFQIGVSEILSQIFFLCIFTFMSNIFIAKEVSSHTYSSRCPTLKGNESQWIQYKEHCYASDRALHNFSEAKQFCSKLGELQCIDFSWTRSFNHWNLFQGNNLK